MRIGLSKSECFFEGFLHFLCISVSSFRTAHPPCLLALASRHAHRSPPGQKSVPLIDARNILRPETVESLFIAYHLSGDPIYREWGWEIFQAFQKYCRVPSGGFASIDDVNAEIPKQQDRMET